MRNDQPPDYLIEDGRFGGTERDDLGVTAAALSWFEQVVAALRDRFGDLPMTGDIQAAYKKGVAARAGHGSVETLARATSAGSAIDRFLRPIAYPNLPPGRPARRNGRGVTAGNVVHLEARYDCACDRNR